MVGRRDIYSHPSRVVVFGRAGGFVLSVNRRLVNEGQAHQELVNEALLMAVEQRSPKPGLIHHSDQGRLHASTIYAQLLSRFGILPSMSRKERKLLRQCGGGKLLQLIKERSHPPPRLSNERSG